jgi:hypothetical protein
VEVSALALGERSAARTCAQPHCENLIGM